MRATAIILASALCGCSARLDERIEPDAGGSGGLDCDLPQAFSPQIFMVDAQTGDLAPPAGPITAEAPASIHLSAIPKISDYPCVWDPTAWRAAGQKNLCDLDRGDYAVNTGLGTNTNMFFGAGVEAPVNVETAKGSPSLCLLMPPSGTAWDPMSLALVHAVSNCVRDRDLAYAADVSQKYLGGSDLAKTQFEWDFDDAGSPFDHVTGPSASHVFSDPGKAHTVTLKVTTETGLVASTKLVVTTVASTRTEVRIRTQADFDALRGGPAGQARWIRLLRGQNFHITSARGLVLGANDWITSYSETAGQPDAVAQGALPTITTDVVQQPFSFASGAHDVLVEQIHVAGGAARAMIASIRANTVVFRDMPFDHITKGFDIGGRSGDGYLANGILIQNVGTPPDAAGNWVNDDLQQNFSLSTARLLSFYGNHFFVAPESYNSEPGVRSNGGELLSLVGNEIGGRVGKFDTISLRGTKNVYVGYNHLRGGVANIQWGVGQDPMPAAVPFNAVFEGNQTDNVTFQLGESTREVSIRNNIMRLRKVANPANQDADPFYHQFPYGSNYLINISGYGATQLEPTDISITGNTFSFEEDSTALGGTTLVIGRATNVTLVDNVFYSPRIVPFHFWYGTAPMSGFSRVEGNAFFVPATTVIGPNGGSIAAWNSLVLGNGSHVADSLFTPGQLGVDFGLAATDGVAAFRPAHAAPWAMAGVNLAPNGDAPTYGAWLDITRTARPMQGMWSPGAVQAP